MRTVLSRFRHGIHDEAMRMPPLFAGRANTFQTMRYTRTLLPPGRMLRAYLHMLSAHFQHRKLGTEEH